MTLLKIAFRNVLKNRRRSLITVLAIAFGYMAVVVFRGYTHNAYQLTAMAAIYLEAPGHLVVFKKGFLDKGRLDPERYLFAPEELETVLSEARALPEAVWVAPKLTLTGLITNGEISTIFFADALAPEDDADLWTHWHYRRPPSPGVSQVLPADKPYAAYLAPKLAELLNLSAGDTAVLMATTRDGQMNAVDIEVVGTYPAMAEGLADKYIRIPLPLARDLYDFRGADRVCVLLSPEASLERARRALAERLAPAGVPVEIRSWDELSQYYRNVKGYLDVVFTFIFSIVVVIVVMSTFNTMSMAVFERTREIGTLRAIGLRPAGVLGLFCWEGAILGFAGSAIGALLSLSVYAALRVLGLTYQPPGVADRIPIEIDLLPVTLGFAGAFFVCLSVVAAAAPARRAAGKPVVDALGHV